MSRTQACAGSSQISQARSAPGPGHDVEVVEVGVRGSDGRAVPAVRHEHDVTGAHLGEHVDRALVEVP